MINRLKKILGDFFVKFALYNSDCTCLGPSYQPEEPEEIKQLIK